MGYFDTKHPQDSGPSIIPTREMIEVWINEPPKPDPVCGVDRPHVVHPHSKGWTMCGNCFGPVWVGEGLR